MNEPSATPVRRRWWKYLLLFPVGIVLLALGFLWYINTDSFQSLVRRRLVEEVEQITGGRAEIGSFHTVPFQMQVDIRNITVHGRESANETPLAHADRIVARLKISSLLRSEPGFHELVVDRPVIHIQVYPDGTTNVPQLAVRETSSRTAIQKLFALSINRLEVRHGEMLWGNQTVPLDFDVRDTELDMNYSFLRRRYLGRMLLGKVETKFDDCRPFSWMITAEFALAPSSIDLTSVAWNSGHSHLNAQGRVSDFRDPRVRAAYDAHIDLTEIAAIARRHDLRGGTLDLKGQGDWSMEHFTASGREVAGDLVWQDKQIAFSKGSLASDYSVTQDQIQLSKLQGRIFGGSLAGDAEIDHWLSPPQHLPAGNTAVISAGRAEVRSGGTANRTRKTEIQSGRVFLRLRDLSAQAVAAGLVAPTHPLGRFNPAALVSGSLDARWEGTPWDADVAFSLDANPPANRFSGLPLTIHANGVYHPRTDSLDLSRFTLSAPGTNVQASGSLSSKSALHLSASASNLDEWRPLIAAFGGPTSLPFTLNGSAVFNGNASGSFSSPILSGSLSVDDFDVFVPATEHTPRQTVHWDSFSTTLHASAFNIALHNSLLRRDDTTAEFDASATLEGSHFTRESPFSLRANLHDFDIAALQAFAGSNYPIRGRVDLFVEASGTTLAPQGQGQVHLTDASAYGQPIRQLDAGLRFAGGEVGLENIHLFQNDSVVTGSAAYNFTSAVFRLDLNGTNFDLARIEQIQTNRVALSGRANFTLQGSGTAAAPAINTDVQIRNLTLNHEAIGDVELHAATQNHEIHIIGNSEFQHGSVALQGSVQLHDDYPVDLSFRMNQLDLDGLWSSYLRGQITGHSSVAGFLVMHGPLRHPRLWSFEANLINLSLDVDNVKVQNQDPIRLAFANDVLHVEQLHMLGQGTDFTAHGSIHTTGPRAIDLAADGHLDLKLLSTVDPDFSASGSVTMNMTVGGTLAEPLPQGRLQVANATMAYAGLPSGLSDLNGSLAFTRDRLRIESLQARTGGGTLDLKGDATYYNQQFNFNLTAIGKDVRLRYPPGVSSTANAELHWIGSRSSSTISGNIMVTRIAVTPGFDFSSYLERSRRVTTVTPANSPLYKVKLDIRVQTAPELQMRTAIARLSGDADLRLRGSIARPAVLGRADILEGQATFHGTKFTLERGDITFANPVAIEPQFNLQASTHVRSYDLNITVTGTPDRGLNINYRSEPPLPKSDIIALLALGRTNQESEQLQEQSGQNVFSDQATALILNQALNATVSSRLQRLFGVSNIRIDPQGLSTETNPIARGPQVTIEQEFSNNLTLSYSTNVSQSSQQIIQGEYYFNRNLSLVGTRDQNGVVSFDIRIRRRKK